MKKYQEVAERFYGNEWSQVPVEIKKRLVFLDGLCESEGVELDNVQVIASVIVNYETANKSDEIRV